LVILPGAGHIGPLLEASFWRQPQGTVSLHRLASWLLLGWGWLQAVGGGLLSVLPLPLWPFQPEQTPAHYALHAIYATLQAPLLITLTRHNRRAPTEGAD